MSKSGQLYLSLTSDDMGKPPLLFERIEDHRPADEDVEDLELAMGRWELSKVPTGELKAELKRRGEA